MAEIFHELQLCIRWIKINNLINLIIKQPKFDSHGGTYSIEMVTVWKGQLGYSSTLGEWQNLYYR